MAAREAKGALKVYVKTKQLRVERVTVGLKT